MVNAVSQEFQIFMSKVMQPTFKGCLRGVSTSRCCIGRGHTHIQSRTASWDSSGCEKISWSGLCFGESSGFCVDTWVCKFQTTQDGVNACVVPSGGFSSAAGFSVLELVVQKGSTQTASTGSRPRAIAKSLLHVGDVVEWRKDTPSARVQVIKPLMRDMRVTQVFDSRHLLPRSFGVE